MSYPQRLKSDARIAADQRRQRIMIDKFVQTPNLLTLRPRRSQLSKMPTREQIRATRALLRWTTSELAQRAQVSRSTIIRCERVDGVPPVQTSTLEHIRVACEAAGVEFIQNASDT
jgi:DNA-binding XRE family transcriptional regulator